MDIDDLTFDKMKADCEALIYDLEHPVSVPLPPPLVVPPPDLTPPGFDEVRLRSASLPPERSAQAVMHQLEGATAGSAESGFIEKTWRQPAFTPKTSAAEVTLSACGSTNGSQASFVEPEWRRPSMKPSPAGVDALLKAVAGVATKLAEALPVMSLESPPFAAETAPEVVSSSAAALQTDPPPVEVSALLATNSKKVDGAPIFASGLGATIRSTSTSLAALPSGPTPPTAPQLLQWVIDTLKQAGPVPAYIAYLSMSDEKADHITRALFETLATTERRTDQDMRRLKRGLAMAHALDHGDFNGCQKLDWSDTNQNASELQNRLYESGAKILEVISRLSQ